MEKQSNDARKPKKQHSAPARNWVGDNGKIIEPLFADYFLSLHPMRCFQGRLFTVDGMIEDEAPLKKEIYEQIRYYATTSVARRIEHIMQAIKLACASEPPEIQMDRIHVRNGTYFADGHFTPEKEYCMNRLPIAYVSDAPAPTRWLQFLNELLYEEDKISVQQHHGLSLYIAESFDVHTNLPTRYFLTFMQKSQRSFPRPSVMLLSQISFGCSPV